MPKKKPAPTAPSNPFDRNLVREPKLGKLITEDGPEIRRDAVHIAVIPMLAGEDLRPGDHVNVTTDDVPVAFRNDVMDESYTRSVRNHRGAVGIVDPFLPDDWKLGGVKKGQRFWLFLYPGQVRTLSHVWTHPAFADEGAPPAKKRTDKEESEAWLRRYAMQYLRYTEPEEAYRKLLRQMETGTITYEGKDMHGREELKEADELKRHAEIVLGKVIDYDDFEYFSCTC